MPLSLTNSFNAAEHPGYVSGRYYLGNELIQSTGSGNGGLSDNGITYVPFPVYTQAQLSRLAIYCSSTSANANAVIGIYSNYNGLPKSLLVDGGGLTFATGGIKEAIISLPVEKAWYWFAGITSLAPFLYLATSFFGNNHILGQLAPATSVNCCLRNIGSYSSLPATAPVDNLSFITGNSSPLFWFKVA